MVDSLRTPSLDLMSHGYIPELAACSIVKVRYEDEHYPPQVLLSNDLQAYYCVRM